MAAREKKQEKNAISNFDNVLSLISKGYTICESLTKLGICRNAFYRAISREQKIELQMVKTSNTRLSMNRLYLF
jgi:hypothetical protein